MVQIIQLHGTDKRLYELVAHLVMDPEVLKQNYNFPFRTSEAYEWFVALDDNRVVGFMPVEHKRHECVVNNYYVEGRSAKTLELLLERLLETLGGEHDLTAVSFVEDEEVWGRQGFVEDKRWTRYVRMRKGKSV